MDEKSKKIESLRLLLFQAENVQHNRVYYLLVAETIFFAAAGAALDKCFVLLVFAFAGIALLILFSIINFKNWFRILWLSESLMREDSIYEAYMRFRGFTDMIDLGPKSLCIYDCLVTESPPMPNPVELVKRTRPLWTHTGFLFTWGIFVIILTVWISIICYGCWDGFCHLAGINPIT